MVRLKTTGTLVRVRFGPEVVLGEVLEEYRRRPEVAAVEPNVAVSAMAFPNDPNFGSQWYLSAIQAREAWSAELLAEEGRQVKTPVIAVLDTGVDIDHPDLAGKIWTNPGERPGDRIDNDKNGYVDDWQGWDFLTNTPDPRPRFDDLFDPQFPEPIHHGTIVAGVAAATSHNGIGVTGVSWSAKIMPLRVLNSQGIGAVDNVVRAVEYATAQRADVLNLSLAATTTAEFTQTLYDALKAADAAGVVVVAAAGNALPKMPAINLRQAPLYPICLDADKSTNFILGVTAVNRQRQLPAFANYGVSCVDIAAPGVDFLGLLTTRADRPDFLQPYGGSWSGTSVAAAIVSGAAAVVRSLRPELSSAVVSQLIVHSVDDISAANPQRLGQIGSGQINLRKVVANALAYRGAADQARGSLEALVVTGLGSGSFPQVKVFTANFDPLKSFFAYAPTFRGSIAVAAGDVTGDGQPEVVTGTGPGGGPHVRIFNLEGQVVRQFFAFDRRARHGVNVAVGKFGESNVHDVVTAPSTGGAPQVVIYRASGEVVHRWYAYDKNFRGGVHLAVGDLDGDGRDEIITGAGSGGGPQVRVFSPRGELAAQFFPFNPLSRFGVNVASGDLDGDGRDEIITSVPRGGLPVVRVYRSDSFAPGLEFFAFPPTFTGGVNLSAGDLDGDGRFEIIAAVASGGEPEVRIFNAQGTVVGSFVAHDARYRGGVRPAFLHRPFLAP